MAKINWELIKQFGRAFAEVKGKAVEVVVNKQRPIFDEDGGTKRGQARITVHVSRANRSIAFSVLEIQKLYHLIEQVLPQAIEAEEALDEERRAWYDRNRVEGDRNKIRKTGKTARKKAAGKAGESYSRAHKSAKSAQSKETASNMGNISKA